jgi:hypothetical protein
LDHGSFKGENKEENACDKRQNYDNDNDNKGGDNNNKHTVR